MSQSVVRRTAPSDAFEHLPIWFGKLGGENDANGELSDTAWIGGAVLFYLDAESLVRQSTRMTELLDGSNCTGLVR